LDIQLTGFSFRGQARPMGRSHMAVRMLLSGIARGSDGVVQRKGFGGQVSIIEHAYRTGVLPWAEENEIMPAWL
jgi:hypothetical protein